MHIDIILLITEDTQLIFYSRKNKGLCSRYLDISNVTLEIPPELKQYLEIVEEGGARHIRCKWRSSRGSECGALFFSLEDAIRHLVTHDPERLRKYLIRYVKAR